MLRRYAGLDKTRLRHLKELVQVCARYDKATVKVYWDILSGNSRALPGDYLYYVDNRVIAYLSVFLFSAHTAEISAMVHPSYRRQKIFTHLLQQAIKQIQAFNIKQIDFVCIPDQTAALAFLAKFNAEFKYRQCVMGRNKSIPEILYYPPVELILASEKDLDLLVEIEVNTFKSSVQEAKSTLGEMLKASNREAWLIYSQEKCVGKIHIRFDTGGVFIHNLGVLPKARKKGYATSAVQQVVNKALLQKQKSISLEVEVNNKSAISIYERCGFVLEAIYDYWHVKLKS